MQVDGERGSVREVQQIIEVINSTLQEAGLTSQPQIMSSGLDKSDIEVE